MMADFVADGHEGHLHGRQEQHQAQEGINDAEHDLADFGEGQFEDGELQDKKGPHNEYQRLSDIPHGLLQMLFETAVQHLVYGIVRHREVEVPF